MQDLAVAALKAHHKDAYVIYPDGQYQLTPTYLMENVIALRMLNIRSHGAVFGEAESEACKVVMMMLNHLISVFRAVQVILNRFTQRLEILNLNGMSVIFVSTSPHTTIVNAALG
jgi:hypothetical protein